MTWPCTLAMLKLHMAHQSPVEKKTVAYARVSSHDQKADLERQKKMLEMYCAAQGWQFMSCRRSSRFWGLGCPKIFHEIEDSLVPSDQLTRICDPAVGAGGVAVGIRKSHL